MLCSKEQYVNIHAHRLASGSEEWVITNLGCNDKPGGGEHTEACFSLGLHPWKILETDNSSCLDNIKNLAKDNSVVAIGECGLDRSIDTPLDLQYELFFQQYKIAEFYRLPLLIHAVKANQEIIKFSKEANSELPFIIHGFRGSRQLAENLIRAGFYLSVGQALLSSDKLIEALKTIPLESLFIETDDSDVSIMDLYSAVAIIKGISIKSLRDHMIEKTNNLFKRK